LTHKDEEEEEEDDEEDDESVDFLGVEFHSMVLLVDDLFHTGSLYNGTKALLGTFCDLGDRQNASVLVEWFPAMLLLLLLLLYYPKALFAVRCSLCWSAGRRRHRSPWKKAVTFGGCRNPTFRTRSFSFTHVLTKSTQIEQTLDFLGNLLLKEGIPSGLDMFVHEWTKGRRCIFWEFAL